MGAALFANRRSWAPVVGARHIEFGVLVVKKGRHRRYEEARALKQTSDGFDALFEDDEEPCPECEALPGHDHRSWCAHNSDS